MKIMYVRVFDVRNFKRWSKMTCGDGVRKFNVWPLRSVERTEKWKEEERMWRGKMRLKRGKAEAEGDLHAS